MRSMFSAIRPFPFALAVAVVSLGRLKGATLSGVNAVEGGRAPLASVAGNGGLSEDSLALFQHASESIGASWERSDGVDAAAWIASISANEDRAVAGLVTQSMGSDPELALQIPDLWQQGSSRTDLIEGGRGRGRGAPNTDRDIALNWVNSDSSTAVPEPSALLLSVLGVFGLRRRRESSSKSRALPLLGGSQ
jgi:hypothetical protein